MENGGNGGEGSFVNAAEKAVLAGRVARFVEGTWNVTTGRQAADGVLRSGDNAHGDLGKSVGGTASGGSGRLAGRCVSRRRRRRRLAAKVTLISSGRVETFSNDAFALFGQSVGSSAGVVVPAAASSTRAAAVARAPVPVMT